MHTHKAIKLAGRIAVGLLLVNLVPSQAAADGLVIPPRDYQGSLEERAQEAIIIFHGSNEAGKATEELILKIQVHGEAPNFAWVVPFPSEPQIAKEDAALFSELFAYVEAKRYSTRKKGKREGACQQPTARLTTRSKFFPGRPSVSSISQWSEKRMPAD